ncbi:hypothetical protein EOM86_08500 [Candidatus Nomurabacteria bacterium]|nr:hypothetical protein [Candidatus Nomurabacteria bacterium]
MKILYLIMGARNDLAGRNIRAILDHPVQNFMDTYNGSNEYNYMYYDGGYAYNSIEDGNHLCIEEDDGIYRTFEKTISALQFIDDCKIGYDWLVRTNISQVVNLWLLDSILPSLDPGFVYGQKNNTVIVPGKWENNIYTRGDMVIMGRGTVEEILNVSDMFFCKDTPALDHTDDVLMGMCLAASDPKYFKRMRVLKYAFFPMDFAGTQAVIKEHPEQLVHTLGIRMKTTPPGKQSGWSWEDNEWRKDDCRKIELVGDFLRDKYVGGDFPLDRDVKDLYESNDIIVPLEYHYGDGRKSMLKLKDIRRLLEESVKK